MYQSPEMFMGCATTACATDVWSLGCLLYELVTKKPLFPGKSECLRPIMVRDLQLILQIPDLFLNRFDWILHDIKGKAASGDSKTCEVDGRF